VRSGRPGDTLPRVVSQITESERIARVQQLLAELHKMPPEKHETVHMPWTAGEPLLEVIRIGVDEVLLNPQSHRIRAQLQDDPEWQSLSEEPYGEPAQRLIERHVRAARTPEEFSALKQSLVQDGQTDPGVMTHTGLLINANTRVVALREVDDPLKRSIRVAVLPPTAKPEDLALLELRLQMQKQLKVEYTMTNELLFIEELSVTRGMSATQIATELRISPESARKGEAEVQLRLKLLDLIRIMQRLPSEPLRLTFFDERISLEQLRELYRVYTPLLESDARAARAHLESFLLSIAVGVSAVHQIRHVDADFMSSYMLPSLEDDELVGPVADALVATPGTASPPSQPAGVELLDGWQHADGEPPIVDTARLIDVVTAADKRVEVPGTNFVLDQDEVKDAVKAAITVGIKDKKRVQRDEDQLAAPSTAVKQATQQIARAKDALLAVHDDPEFDERTRKTLEAAHKKMTRTSRDLETALVKAGVIQKS
jgi:hypothetical protein